MFMETLMAISVAVIAAIMVLFLLLMIPVLLKVLRIAREIEWLIDTVRTQIAPVSRDIIVISQDVKDIVRSIRRQVDKVEDGVATAHDMVTWAKHLKEELKWRVEQPVLRASAVMGGIKRGFEVMSQMFKSRHKEI
jgi:hypothetical protein